MKNTRAIVGIVLVFVLGAASGALVTHMQHQARFETFLKKGAGAREDVIMERLTRQLKLSSQQQLQVRSIVHENHSSMRQIRRQYRPQLQSIIEEGQTRISTLLTPQQQERFREIIQERRKRPPHLQDNQ